MRAALIGTSASTCNKRSVSLSRMVAVEDLPMRTASMIGVEKAGSTQPSGANASFALCCPPSAVSAEMAFSPLPLLLSLGFALVSVVGFALYS